MAQINKSDEYFNTVLYTGDGTSNRNITGFGFQPDFLWQKARNQTFNHYLFDSVRGNSSVLKSNTADAQNTSTTGFNGFISDGFNVSQVSGWEMNNSASSVTYANWCWLGANGTASNTDGSITSTVSASTVSGFSIVSYTGTGANATVGHGLGVAPKMVIIKNRTTAAQNWQCYHSALGGTQAIELNTTSAAYTDSTRFNNTDPTSSVFSIGTSTDVNTSSASIIAYCFAEKKGFSKFGSYTGNGNADGSFIYLGFKPAFFLGKRTNSTGEWFLIDNKRNNSFNPQDRILEPNSNLADISGATYKYDFLSNGVKIRTTSGAYGNGSGDSFIYMAFAENPLVGTNNIPATAR